MFVTFKTFHAYLRISSTLRKLSKTVLYKKGNFGLLKMIKSKRKKESMKEKQLIRHILRESYDDEIL